MNRAICTALLSVGVAQLLKAPLKYRQTGKWDWSNLIEAGGMPSSHSAGVSSLAAYTLWKRGAKSFDFAMAALFGAIVMYDAMGVRRHAGEIAVEVNDLEEEVEQLANRHPGIYHRKRDKELKERLGHLPSEVLGGSLLGAAIGTASYWLEGPSARR